MTEDSNFEIEAHVAEVTSVTQIALNAGINLGVEEGDEVVLYRRVDVNDPITGDFLGPVLYPKLKLKITMVDDLLSVAKVTDRYYAKSNTAGGLPKVSRLKRVTKYEEEETSSTVLVVIGEVAFITRPKKEAPTNDDPWTIAPVGEEPPF